MSKPAQQKGRISSKNIKRLVFVSIIVAVFALGATAAVSLRTGQTKSSANEQRNAQANDARAGLRYQTGAQVPLNPQTGQVRPLTQEEAQRLAAGIKALVNQSTDGLKEVHHADGSVSMDLQGRFQSIAVARRDEDGQLVQSCIDNPQAAAAFFKIDPALVGVKTAPQTAPNTNSAEVKGGVR
jgi:hypothetical protein